MKYDLVLLGATSFVGRLTAEYLLKLQEEQGFSMAFAGRSLGRIERLKDRLGAHEIDMIEVNVKDKTSVDYMVQSAKVVITVVGPYAELGEPIVAACAKHGVDYVDLTGESPWVKRMIDKYSVQAIGSGARIVHSCGFDSIPSDLGVFALNRFASDQQLDCDRIDMRVVSASGGLSGGTIASLAGVIKKAAKSSKIRRLLKDPYALCPAPISGRLVPHARQDPMLTPHIDEDFDQWRAPFLMATVNTKVVHRSNYLLDASYGQAFVYSEAMLTGSGLAGRAKATAITAGLGAVTAGYTVKVGQKILGWVMPSQGDGPSQSSIDNGKYVIKFTAKQGDQAKARLKLVAMGDPGYGSTSKMLSHAALALLETDKSVDGGFWTPASVMGEPLLERLEQHHVWDLEYSTL